MGTSRSPLTPFEQGFLRRFFASVRGFYLGGGGALGIHLGHRRSIDLDLFTPEEVAFQAAVASLPAVAGAVGGRVEILTDAPAFRRVLLTGREGDTVRVDLVWDASPRTASPPVEVAGMWLDPPQEILVNKICTILGRSELRDLVDLLFLERAGYRALDALDAARRKDPGLTPAQLAWAITQVRLDRLPEGMLVPVSIEELRAFAARLVDGLERLAFPGRGTPRTRPPGEVE